MIKALASLALLLFYVPGVMANENPRNVAAELAPTGKLRVAINFGNTVLAQRDPAGGAPRGVSARACARARAPPRPCDRLRHI